jgi:hypothetical protein
MKNYLVQAIFNLRPNSEFVVYADDYATIEWHVLVGTAPTQAEINAEILKIKAQDELDKTVKATDKAALLERLGITADEAALLLG